MSQEDVSAFFERFTKSAEGVLPENMFNCDESNLSNNVGAVQAIFRRGTKYAEHVRDSTKTCISIMFCGSASGVMMPPYVVYKASNIYDSWCTGGPKGAVYNSSHSGWFDGNIYTDWFKKVFLPHARRKPGKKLLIADNLASHISVEVIELCKKHNIAYVCLSPNATDKMQPLDVGVFGPMKRAWRQQLQNYADKDPSACLLTKTIFPAMLRELLDGLKPGQYLPKAFEKCGLFPINKEKVLERIPSTLRSEVVASHIDKALLKTLEVRRFGEKAKKKPRGQKIPAGQSYSQLEEEEEDEVSGVDSSEDESEQEDESEKESEQEAEVVLSGFENTGFHIKETADSRDELPDVPVARKNLTSYVVAVYEGQWFLAEIYKDQSNVSTGYTRLNYMSIKGTNSFAWNLKEDIHIALDADILIEPVIPEPVNSRGHLGLRKKDLEKVSSLMVVVFIPIAFIRSFYLSILSF